MKKMMAIALAALMLLAIGCTGAKETKPAAEAQPTAVAEQPTAAPTEEPLSDHDRAMQLIEAGDFDAAYELLGKIGETETIAANKYDRAKSMIEVGDYETAYALLDGLDYQDSAELLSDVKFQLQKISISIAEKGDYVTFGAYEQDNDPSNGKEDIEWLVLDKDESSLLLISKYVLDYQHFNETETDVTWETCTLRGWLNDSFLNAAFNSEEKKLILDSTVTADENPFIFGMLPGNDTIDKVFLLSTAEAFKYFSWDGERECSPTDYALEKETRYSFFSYESKRTGNTGASWLLRTYDSDYLVDSINLDGSLGSSWIDKDIKGIRPCIWIGAKTDASSKTISEAKYKRAVSLIESGNYQAAYTLLNGLNFKDSADLLSKVEAAILSEEKIKVGDYIVFGSYEQDNDLSNDKEGIEWLILDQKDDKYLVISRYILDCKPYNTDKRKDITWETSSLRAWLNEEFYSTSFTADQQKTIANSSFIGDGDPFFKNSSEQVKTDKVFLLSLEQSSRLIGEKNSKLYKQTEYAKTLKTRYNDSWWVVPSYDIDSKSSDAYICFYSDIFGYYLTPDAYSAQTEVHGIRPAMWITLEYAEKATDQTPVFEASTSAFPDDATLPAELIGRWGIPYDVYVYEFREDGTGLRHKGYDDTEFTYAAKDGKVYLRITGATSLIVLPYRIEGDKLILTENLTKNYAYDETYTKRNN